MEQIQALRAQAGQSFDKLSQSMSRLRMVQSELSKLKSFGDLVDADDVMQVASRMTARGFSPLQLASLLADMPQNSAGIAQWVQGLWTQTVQREQALAPQLEAARHSSAVMALQELMVHHIAGATPGGQAATAPDTLAMNPQGGVL